MSQGANFRAPGINTDEFGAFTRDIKRSGDQLADQLNVARLKAEKAMALTGLTPAFASEGSFGPHPSIPFWACDREIVLLSDRRHDLEIVGQAISTETNYGFQSVTTLEAALTFAQKIGFPNHGLVTMSDAQPTDSSSIFIRYSGRNSIDRNSDLAPEQFGQAHLETDMRTMHNLTRMKVIAEATQDLIHQINRCCPECGCPGFAPVEYKAGLPYGLCGFPTDLTWVVVNLLILQPITTQKDGALLIDITLSI